MIGSEPVEDAEDAEDAEVAEDAEDSVVTQVVYYLGRFGQIVGMWILLVDVVTAGPLGPNPRLFAAGVAVFLAGWGLTRVVRRG